MIRNHSMRGLAAPAISRAVAISAAMLAMTLLFACAAHPTKQSFPVTATPGLELSGVMETHAQTASLSAIANALSSRWPEPLDLETPDARKAASSVDSCAALVRAIRSSPDLQPADPSETPFYLYRANICLAIQALDEAAPAKLSFVRAFRLDAAAPDRLPAELAFAISGEDLEYIKNYRGQTLKTLFNAGDRFDLKDVEVLNAFSARFTDSTDGIQKMTILGYGDFNADGYEDLLLLVQNSIANASYQASTLYQLTRANEGPLRVLREYALLQQEETRSSRLLPR